MRRAFTLIELLVIIAIMATMVLVSVLNVRAGQGAVRLKGAVRDIFGKIRTARSTALLSQQPSIITYSTETVDGEPCVKVEVVAAKVLSSDQQVTEAQTLSGKWVSLVEADRDDRDGRRPRELEHRSVAVAAANAKSAAETKSKVDSTSAEASADQEGKTVDEVLFAPISTDVVRGLRVKVTVGDEALACEDQGAAVRRNKISVFSTTDYLIGKYSEKRRSETDAAETASASSAPAGASSSFAQADDGPKSIVWEVNGRTQPHRIWIYPDGKKPDEGLSIAVDRFGGAKILGKGEDE